MLNVEQSKIAISLIRKHARIMRGEPFNTLGLMNSLVWAQETQLPDQFLLPLSSFLCRSIAQGPFDASVLPSAVGLLFNKNQRCAARNLETLKCFQSRIFEELATEGDTAILVGDGAALTGLYGDPGAIPSVHWAALLQDGTYVDNGTTRPFGMPQEHWSEKIQFGNACWRRPKPALLAALVAAHVGDPLVPPASFLWQHLGLTLLVWKESIRSDEICGIGKVFGKQEQVARGLALTAQIFPELKKWLKVQALGIPAWERNFALPIAARRLTLGGRN